MATIQNGFKLRYKKLDTVFYEMQPIRAAVLETASVEAAKMAADIAVRLYDNITLSGETLGGNSIAKAYEAITGDLKFSESNGVRSMFDLEFSIALGVTIDKTVLGILQCNNDSLRHVLESHPDYDGDYSYWDDKYRDTRITNHRWAKRKQHWNEVLPNGFPTQEMFNMTFVAPYTFPLPDKLCVEHNITKFEKRLRRLTESSTMSILVKDLNLDPSDIIKFRMENNAEWETMYAAHLEVVRSKIKKDLTIEDLLEKI